MSKLFAQFKQLGWFEWAVTGVLLVIIPSLAFVIWGVITLHSPVSCRQYGGAQPQDVPVTCYEYWGLNVGTFGVESE